MFKNVIHIFQIYDRILIIITNWCLECALRGDTGGRVHVVGSFLNLRKTGKCLIRVGEKGIHIEWKFLVL